MFLSMVAGQATYPSERIDDCRAEAPCLGHGGTCSITMLTCSHAHIPRLRTPVASEHVHMGDLLTSATGAHVHFEACSRSSRVNDMSR